MRFFKLVKEDGWFLIPAPKLLGTYFEVFHCYQEFKVELSSIIGFIPSDITVENTDNLLLPYLSDYYQAISRLFLFDYSFLTPVSRHTFFVDDGSGISGLEYLLGFEQPIKNNDNTGISITTGEYALDIITSASLVFKENTKLLLENFCLTDLSKMLKYATSVQNEDIQQKLQEEKDKELFEKNLTVIGGTPF